MKSDNCGGCQPIVAGRRDIYSAPVLILAGAGGIARIVRAVRKVVREVSNIPYALLQSLQFSGSSYR